MKLLHLVLVCLFVLLSACDRPASKGSQNLLLVFGDQEEGEESFKTRILVTADYMRFDDGEDAGDFLVFDRKHKTIYNVVQENKTITVITSQPTEVKPPFELKLSNKKIDDMQDAPSMDGVKPTHYVYLSGEQICFEVLSVPGFLPAYVEAMQEFNIVLANDSALTLNNLPADMQKGCSLAQSIFAPNRHFTVGFPIQQWSPDGSHSVLLDFKKDYQADKLLFEIPTSYRRLTIQEIRTGLAGQK